MTITRSNHRAWKDAIKKYLSAPIAPTLRQVNTLPKTTPKPNLQALFLNVLLQIGLSEINEAMELLQFLHLTVKSWIVPENETSLIRKLDAIESAVNLTAGVIKINSPALKFSSVWIDKVPDLFNMKDKSDYIKCTLLDSMLSIYFADDQNEFRKSVRSNLVDLMLKDDIFKDFTGDQSFKDYLNSIFDNLLKQSDRYAETYCKFLINKAIKNLSFNIYLQDKHYFLQNIFYECYKKALANNIVNYKIDRTKALPAYKWLDLYKQSSQSEKLDHWHKTSFALKILFFISLWSSLTNADAVLAPLSTATLFVLYVTYLSFYAIEVQSDFYATGETILDDARTLLDIKLIKNQIEDKYEFKLAFNARVIAPTLTDNTNPFYRKVKKVKLIAKATTTVVAAEIKPTDMKADRQIISAKDNQYYLLANKSFLRYNAQELDANRDSINSNKLAISAVIKHCLDKSNIIHSVNSTEEGLKYLSLAEKKELGRKDCAIKFKFKGVYSSLRLFMGTRLSTSEESNLLGSNVTVHSPRFSTRK